MEKIFDVATMINALQLYNEMMLTINKINSGLNNGFPPFTKTR